MQSAADLSRLIDDIYTAAETGDGMSQHLEMIRQVLCANSAHLMHYAPVTNEVVVVHLRCDPGGVEAYQNYFHRIDPWNARLPIQAMSAGTVLPGTAVLSREDLKKTEFYADFGRRFGVTRTLFGVTGHSGDGSHVAISANRNDHQDEFGADAIAYVSLLVPHLSRAIQTRSLWATASTPGGVRTVTWDVLDALPYGVVLVDAHAGVCFANPRASAILARRDGITEDGGRLSGATAGATRALRNLCAEIAATRGVVPRRAGATLHLPRAHAASSLQVLATPVAPASSLAVRGRDVVAVLFISDPSETAVPDATLLREAFGLTPAESRVAVLLAAGHSVDEIAAELGYTIETTRWYSKQVLAKTDSRSRGEFIARAVSSIAMLRAR